VKPDDIAIARTCYAHLAGMAGVALFAALEARGLIALDGGGPRDRHHRPAVRVTAAGRAFLAGLGYDGPLDASACLDGTERRPHLAGPLGRELTRLLLARGLVARRPGTRAVTMAPGWLATLGLEAPAAAA